MIRFNVETRDTVEDSLTTSYVMLNPEHIEMVLTDSDENGFLVRIHMCHVPAIEIKGLSFDEMQRVLSALNMRDTQLCINTVIRI